MTNWSSVEADWVKIGSGLFRRAMASLSDGELKNPSLLDGWSRSHVVSHVSANAQAIGRLLHWAKTGEVTHMYPSVEERDEEISQGAQLAGDDLRAWWTRTDDHLLEEFATLPAGAWKAQVLTAQGREVPASETLWMRSREICIHAVDLAASVDWEDLPESFLRRLIDEAVSRHSSSGENPAVTIVVDDGESLLLEGVGDPVETSGNLSNIAAWLTGRTTKHVQGDSASRPQLGKWL